MELVIQHWLVSVVRAAKVPGSDGLSVDSETDTSAAWDQVVKATKSNQDALADLVARHFRLPRADLKQADSQAWRLVPADVARRLHVLPLRYSDRNLTVATADPVSLESERELAHVSGRSVQNEVASPARILEAIADAYPEQAVDPKQVENKGKQHILVVEDDAETRLVFRTALQSHGYRVTEAADGKSALARLAAADEVYALASLDLGLPDINGLEVLRGVRDSLRTAMLPVIIATGTDDPKVAKQLLESGADDYIVKPVDPTRFVTRVKAVLLRRNPRLVEHDTWG